jgi:hypothetical protein
LLDEFEPRRSRHFFCTIEIPRAWPDDLIVGIPQKLDVAETLEIALRLQPDTHQVVIVDGINSGGLAQGDVSSLAKRVEFRWLTNRSLLELRDELARLPDHTVVFYGTMFRDPAGNAFSPTSARFSLLLRPTASSPAIWSANSRPFPTAPGPA